jgi:beta-galactosidase
VHRRRFLLATGTSAVMGGFGIADRVMASGGQGSSTEAAKFPRKSLFDFDWKFNKGDVPNGANVDLDDAHWQMLSLPHDWSIEGPFSETNPSGAGGAFLPGGIGWYRKSFSLPEGLAGKHVEVEFDGVYMNSDVWFNGRHLGKRPYGYVSFAYDITAYLQPGKKKNVLAVRVDNSLQPNSRWYSGSGIYRHVWLAVAEPLHVDLWGTYVRTPLVSQKSATVEISTRVKNEKRCQGGVRLVTLVRDAEGRVLSKEESAHSFSGEPNHIFDQKITMENPKLWSPDQPVLYTAVSEVYQDGRLVDQYMTPFGVRTFKFDADSGFSLNGQAMKLKGVCIHHDLGALGAAFHEPAMERRLHLLKAMGCNAIRMSHNPPAPQLLDMCDRLGFLVMDEAFDVWRVGKRKYDYHLYFDEWGLTDLRDMIYRDRNHPSIVLWSIGNEIPEKGRPEGVATARLLVRTVNEADPTRPVTCAVNSIEAANRSGLAEVLDVVGYNGGGGSVFDYDRDHRAYPSRKMFGSEVPHTGQTRGVYQSDKNYCSSYDDCLIRISSEGSWKLTSEKPFVAGEFRWTGIDYLGEPIPHWRFHIPSREPGHFWPARSGDFGVIDTCGFPKDAYYFYQSRWTQRPMVHVFPHWTWDGKEGQPIFIWCYTNCEAVELFLNGHSLGTRHTNATPAYHLMWQVGYQPGTLRAVGRNGGREVCSQEIHTARKPARIVLKSERDWIKPDRRDLAYIAAAISDEEGNLVPAANNLLRFEIAGGGKIIGVDNGDPLSHESFKASSRRAFNGLCLVVVQSTGRRGRIVVTVTSDGLATGTLAIESRS